MNFRLLACSVMLSACLLALPGCDSFLDTEPGSFTGSENYYQTPQQIERAVNGAYGGLQEVYDAEVAYWAMAEMRSDNTVFQYNAADRGLQNYEEIDEFTITVDNESIEEVWQLTYGAIQQTNVILSRIGNVEFADASRRDQYTGEAEFLRAFNYFNLVRLWGGVPLVTREVQSPDDAFSDEGRATVDEVYEQIIADAQGAVEKLPSSYGSSQLGRATEGAARVLLAEVYMTRGDFEAAIEQLQAVEGLGYSLVPDYAQIFGPADENSSESIFELQYDAGVEGEESLFPFRFVPLDAAPTILAFPNLFQEGYNLPTTELVDAFESEERLNASVGFYVAEGNASSEVVAIGDSIPYPRKLVNPPVDGQGRTSQNWPVYRYSRALLMLAEALNETGQTAAAYPYINRVRDRVGLDDLSGLSQDEFREAVYREMWVELAFENYRWYHLLRTGRALERMEEHAEGLLDRSPRLRSSGSYNIQEYKLLYPIPQREVRLNSLTQNPGW